MYDGDYTEIGTFYPELGGEYVFHGTHYQQFTHNDLQELARIGRHISKGQRIMDRAFAQIPCDMVGLATLLQRLLDPKQLITVGDKVQYCIGTVDGMKVMTVQGTADWNDWQDNLETWQETVVTFGTKVKVSKGAFDQYRIAKEVIASERPDVLQGHSLGGQVVQYASARYGIPTVTYGSPRAGNDAFARLVDRTVVRVHHKGDNVSYLPWRVWPTWHPPFINFYSHGNIPCMRVGKKMGLVDALRNKEHHVLSYVNAVHDYFAEQAKYGLGQGQEGP